MEGGFFDWEAPLIERYFRKGSRILVAAAGTGREILALRDAGFSADGFECNPSLLAAGRKIFEQLGQSHSVVFCEPDRVPTGPQIYEGLIVGWSAYTHIPTRLRRVRFLQALRGRTLPHSALVMSFFIRNESSRYSAMTYRAGAIFRILFRGRKDLWNSATTSSSAISGIASRATKSKGNCRLLVFECWSTVSKATQVLLARHCR